MKGLALPLRWNHLLFSLIGGIILASGAMGAKTAPHQSKPLIDDVDPMIGTAGGGNVFPGAVAPFGMVQFSPDTHAPSIGYSYRDSQIQGFSLTHMSGVGCDDDGDVFLTATTGPIHTRVAGYASPFDHAHEHAAPGYYQVRLNKWHVNVQLTASDRTGVATFTFPKGKTANILIPISHTLTRTAGANIRVINHHEIVGHVTSQCFCGNPHRYTTYFVMRFDHPFSSFGTWRGDHLHKGWHAATQAIGNNPPIGAYVRYGPNGPRNITVHIGISFVDIHGAENNLDQETAGKSFQQVRTQTQARWSHMLHTIEVKGGTQALRRVFYTALYHSLLMPNLFDDADGRYVGFDRKIHHVAKGHHIYANYSGWDIYRTEAPLLALVAPGRYQDMCQSIVNMYKQGGWIGRWPQANQYTNVMLGSPLTTFIATGWAYGLHHFDIATAYQGMLKDATTPAPPHKPYAGESAIKYMNQVHYIPDDKEQYGSVSQTEEDCVAYAALAQVEKSLGKTSDARMLIKRALYYRNLFNPKTDFLQPKLLNGKWRTPFHPTQQRGYVEGSAWQYRWLVPQDLHGLIKLMGGDKTFDKNLDAFFQRIVAWNGRYYNPENETDLEAPFLYDYAGQPWNTQSLVRRLLKDVYHVTPNGIPGNDDCGTMSAWAVFSMMGFYPVEPWRPSFVLCSPTFKQVTIHLGKAYHSKTFTVVAKHAAASLDHNQYIQSVKVDGKTHTACWFSQRVIAKGGSLTVTLGSKPDKSWGSAPADRPASLSDKR